ncbi:hypothetical protein JTB14_003590 [Gonioctena quinquepunctata]|nr:hypothetical protein JTB14_003590 [Gonioctena quinquepunctata]
MEKTSKNIRAKWSEEQSQAALIAIILNNAPQQNVAQSIIQSLALVYDTSEFRATWLYPFKPETIPEHAFASSIPIERPAPAKNRYMIVLGSIKIQHLLDTSDDGFSDEDLIPVKQLGSHQQLSENENVELGETILIQTESPLRPEAQDKQQSED